MYYININGNFSILTLISGTSYRIQIYVCDDCFSFSENSHLTGNTTLQTHIDRYV